MKNKLLVAAVLLAAAVQPAWCLCEGEPIDPLADICWECIFPIRIAGVQVSADPPGDVIEPPDPTSDPICRCLVAVVHGVPIYRYGVTFSMWEPARYIETVKDPYCLPFYGMSLGPSLAEEFELRGSIRDQGNNEDSGVFAQAHFFWNPYWAGQEEAIDNLCREGQSDIPGYMTEFDPMWNADQLSAIIHPESALHANLASQMACMADASGALAGLPLANLYWCLGSWGSAYPLAGRMGDGRGTEANAGVAARLVFKLLRQLMIRDFSVDYCHGEYTPIWQKWHWRLQIARPEVGHFVIPIGRSATIWGAFKNPVYNPGQDNFVWILFRRRFCCVGSAVSVGF